MPWFLLVAASLTPWIVWRYLGVGRHGLQFKLRALMRWNSLKLAWQFYKSLRKVDKLLPDRSMIDRLEIVLQGYSQVALAARGALEAKQRAD